MSSQLDFIMQLYMMNLLQQQQQQQQQRQQESQHHQNFPTDLKFQNVSNNRTTTTSFSGTKTTIAPASTTTIATITAASTAASTSTSTDLASTVDENSLGKQSNEKTEQTLIQENQNQNQIKNENTKRSDNSESINCSNSSSSCSPNSKFRNNLSEFLTSSPNTTTTTTSTTISFNPLQQMLFNQLSPENLMSQSINVPLTPTTPNSQMLELPFNLTTKLPRTGDLALKNITDLFLGGIGGNNDSNNINNYINNTNNNNNNNNTNNLYQLTQYPNNINNFNNSKFSAEQFLQSSTVTSTPTEKSPLPQADISAVGEKYVVGTNNEMKIEGKTVGEDDVEEEDDKPLSSLYSSSGAASTSTGSGETSSKLLMSGFQALESTSDSYESLNAPYTPIKQSADSSISSTMALFKDTPLLTRFSSDHDDANVTPMVHANALPTPPSSEQLISKKFDAAVTFSSQSTNTFSSSDNLLTNEENLKNLRKVSSYLECENPLCRQENLREHFHCHEEPCQGKILSKKDDIIRHLKWHKKRKESLLLGFARFTSSDDCAPEYGENCTYNWKQTHYHCIYEDCPKVYVSTSDVQMHSNFHRKNTEIVQEGFRRFRAHENCKILECPFYGKKISHYHCCRENCNHTFKNKADMEKHKTYHLKDYQLTQDGFKKILKTEACPFEACKFSTVCNHIHCVRESCNYILHSSSQMVSHKRKHDRADSEQAYQTFKKEKDSSEEESTPSVPINTHASTPLSSLSAEHFLSRKRGRPPKKIQMPTATETNGVGSSKRTKIENNDEQNSLGPNIFGNFPTGIYPPFFANFNPATAAMATQNMPSSDPSAPNVQLTHLMALFQLQNPLFYQNWSGGVAANMANMLNSAFGNSGTFNTGSNGQGTNVKSELNEEKPQFKE